MIFLFQQRTVGKKLDPIIFLDTWLGFCPTLLPKDKASAGMGEGAPRSEVHLTGLSNAGVVWCMDRWASSWGSQARPLPGCWGRTRCRPATTLTPPLTWPPGLPPPASSLLNRWPLFLTLVDWDSLRFGWWTVSTLGS